MTATPTARDLAAVLAHLNIAKADVTGCSQSSNATIRMAVQHPDMVRNLIVNCNGRRTRDGWFPEILKAMAAVSSAQADQMKQTPIYTGYVKVAPHPEQFPLLLDHMGELMGRGCRTRRQEIAGCRCRRCCCSPITTTRRRNTVRGVLRLVWQEEDMQDPGWEGTPRSTAKTHSPSCRALRVQIWAKGRISPA